MLVHLSIRNLALIAQLETELKGGFTALTGETGAGKSLLLDALSLLLGARADATLIRHGEATAEVAGLFKPAPTPALQNWLEVQGLELEEGMMLIRRQLKREGGGKVWANGVPISATALAELAGTLGEIQGQHSAPDLLQPARQRVVVDTAAQIVPLQAAVASAHGAWQQAEQAHKAAAQALAEAEEQAGMVATHKAMLEALAYTPAEEVALAQQRQRLQHAGHIRQAVQQADEALNAEGGALRGVRAAQQALKQAAAYDETLAPTVQTLAETLAQLEDIAHDLARATVAEPEGSVESIDDRLHALKGAARTLGCAVEELPLQAERLNAMATGLGPLREAENTAALAVTKAYNAFHAACQTLTSARAAAAETLAPQLQQALRALLLPHAHIHIRLNPLPVNQWGPMGAEGVEILLAANPGSPLQPIQKVASGGELARLMLALKQVLYAALPPQMLVLDEVDTGLSGAAASAVGAAMAVLGQRHQVLAVTHHAQVAAQAGHHGTLAKQVENGTTTTHLRWLEGHAREAELARLLAGATLTPEAHAAAQALLREARAA